MIHALQCEYILHICHKGLQFFLIDRQTLFVIKKHIFVVFACVFWQGLDNNIEFQNNKQHIELDFVYNDFLFFWNNYTIVSFMSYVDK